MLSFEKLERNKINFHGYSIKSEVVADSNYLSNSTMNEDQIVDKSQAAIVFASKTIYKVELFVTDLLHEVGAGHHDLRPPEPALHILHGCVVHHLCCVTQEILQTTNITTRKISVQVP